MHIICGKEELMKGVQIVSPIAPARSTLPVVSNSLLEIKENRVKLSSTDLEISVQCYIKGEVLEEGAVTIPTKRFADIIRELSPDKEIEIKSDEANQINIKSGKSKFNLMGIPKSEFPVLPEFSKENTFTIKREEFASMLRKTIFAVSGDIQRYVLNGVCFVMAGNKLSLVATDGRRLAYVVNEKMQKIGERKAIVPTKAATNMLRLLSSDTKSDSVNISTTDNQIAMEADDIAFLSTLIEGTFPNYEQVIPKKSELKIKLNVEDTLAAVKQMALLTGDGLSSDRSSAIKFYFSADVLKISASTAGVGSGEVELEVEYKGKPDEINFNPNFIKDVLQNIGEDSAVFEFTNALNPAVVSPVTDKNYLCIIMPMRV